MILSFLLLASAPALAGDLWLDVHQEGDPDIQLSVPANWLRDSPTPLRITVDGVEVDLREVAREVDDRLLFARRTYRRIDDEGDELKVKLYRRHHPNRDEPRISVVHMEAFGPGGSGLEIDVPIQGTLARLGFQLAAASFTAKASIPGISIPWGDGGFLDQIAFSSPRVLAEGLTAEGYGFLMESR